MDPLDESKDIVHPEVRAHINSLVSAVSDLKMQHVDMGEYCGLFLFTDLGTCRIAWWFQF